MQLILLAIVLLVFMGLFFKYEKFSISQTSKIKSKFDGISRKVHTNHPDYKNAAKVMSILNDKNIRMMSHLRDKYIMNPMMQHKYPDRYNLAITMMEKYSPDVLVENSPMDIKGDTSYTLNKGKTVAICLRNKKNLNLHDLNTLTFVTLHELTHLSIKDRGHTKKFWRSFKFVLEEANELNLLKLIDYSKNVTYYCNGLMIDHNPFFDTKILSII